MIVTIHQPNYLPYLGFFHKLLISDVFVLFDTAQYSKHSFQNRNRIKTPRGATWLTVPVRRGDFRSIQEAEIDRGRDWAARHWAAIQANYARAANFDTYADQIRRILEKPWKQLAALNEALILAFARFFDLGSKVLRSSDLPIRQDLPPSERLAEIVRHVGGDTYISGVGGLDYIDPRAFRDINLRLQAFRHPEYPQLWGPFLNNLSAIDLLMNVGAEGRSLLEKSGGSEAWPGPT